MSVPNTKVRTVQDIRTHSGGSNQRTLPYQAYLRIAILEMEKRRRQKERESAVTRVNGIDARFRDIDAQQEELLRVVGKESHTPAPPEKAKREGTDGQENGAPFRIRY